MAEVRSKIGSRKKGRRSAHMKAYYQAFRAKYPSKQIRRRARREKQLAFFRQNPTSGSPSQVIMRIRVNKHKLKETQ